MRGFWNIKFEDGRANASGAKKEVFCKLRWEDGMKAQAHDANRSSVASMRMDMRMRVEQSGKFSANYDGKMG